MPERTETGDPGMQAARSLLHEGQALLDKGLELAIAVALGWLAARWMRRRGLHWSWAVSALLPVLLLDRLLGPLGPAVVVAVAVAAVRGRRWHHEDIDAGQDLARIARRRLTPLAAARGRIASRRAGSGGVSRPRQEQVGQTLLLGRERDGRAVSVPFEAGAGSHTLVADLRLPGRERTLEQVMGNLSLLIAHRQVVPASAELLSRLGGTRGAWRVSWSSSGRSTRTRISEPRLEPELLADLAPGWAAVIPFGCSARARVARIVARSVER